MLAMQQWNRKQKQKSLVLQCIFWLQSIVLRTSKNTWRDSDKLQDPLLRCPIVQNPKSWQDRELPKVLPNRACGCICSPVALGSFVPKCMHCNTAIGESFQNHRDMSNIVKHGSVCCLQFLGSGKSGPFESVGRIPGGCTATCPCSSEFRWTSDTTFLVTWWVISCIMSFAMLPTCAAELLRVSLQAPENEAAASYHKIWQRRSCMALNEFTKVYLRFTQHYKGYGTFDWLRQLFGDAAMQDILHSPNSDKVAEMESSSCLGICQKIHL